MSRVNLFGLVKIRRMGKSSVLRVFLDVTYLRLRMKAERRRGLGDPDRSPDGGRGWEKTEKVPINHE